MTLRYAAEQMTTLESVRTAPDCGCITPEDPSDDDLNRLIDSVSDTIARLSGMRVRGRVGYLARPCRTGCVECCPCCGLDGIPLGDKSPAVSRVLINGVELDTSEYALHSSTTGWNLVRLRSAADLAANRRPRDWPSFQDRWRDWESTTDLPTFAIVYEAGSYVDDVMLERAVNELVCDLLTEQANVDQALPAEAVGANLGGVNITLASDRISAITERLDRVAAGQLGPAFTRFMGIFAPDGRATPVAWSPELLGGWNLNLSYYTPPAEDE